MIFKAIRIYRMSKQGINDPAGLVSEEVRDAFVGVAAIPAVILLAVLILLGILSFTSLITQPSGVAQVFFWILLLVEIAYATVVFFIARFLNRAVRHGAEFAKRVHRKIVDAE